ncbi:hypothetical protein K435DRAFT_227123 [Dendrothele bispora CBS 962.96]|uniref:HAD-like protein n=1 Tax=Dendrothele bispora (strain CBS 962.96) TaxID=1314807 RepID=A0A4S8LQH5_DENBC|nr:hypothetical protein K435DRAFT_227123 [Dendrothele bispora CBS 962.96]
MFSATSLDRIETSTPPINEVQDSHIARSLDVLSSASPPTSSGPVIAVDLDDVLSQTNAKVAEWHNATYGTKMTLSDFYYYYYWKNPYWGNLQETFDKVRSFYDAKQIFDVMPVPGAREGVQTLKDMGFRLIIVTARSTEVKEDSWSWIQKWFPDVFDTVICTGQFKDANKAGHEVTTKLSKAQVCANLKARLLIDDSAENALQVSTSSMSNASPAPPTPVLLFGQYEWNKRVSLPSDQIDAMVFDTRLKLEEGREFWKEEKLEDRVPENAPMYRVKDWGEVVRWVKKAKEEGTL